MEPTNLQTVDPIAITRHRTFPTGLFAVAILMFFFTFCEMSCQGTKFAEISGISLATGTQVETPSANSGSIFGMGTPKPNTKDMPANPWAAIALLAAAAGLVFYAIRHKKESQAGLIAGAAGAVALLVLKLNLQSAIAKEANGMVSLSFALPYWISLLSLAGAAALSWMRQQQPSPALGNIPTFQTPPQGKAPISRPLTQSEQPIQSSWKPMPAPSFQSNEPVQPPTIPAPPSPVWEAPVSTTAQVIEESFTPEPPLAPTPVSEAPIYTPNVPPAPVSEAPVYTPNVPPAPVVNPAPAPLATPTFGAIPQAAPVVRQSGNNWLIPLVLGAVGLMVLATILVEFRVI